MVFNLSPGGWTVGSLGQQIQRLISIANQENKEVRTPQGRIHIYYHSVLSSCLLHNSIKLKVREHV